MKNLILISILIITFSSCAIKQNNFDWQHASLQTSMQDTYTPEQAYELFHNYTNNLQKEFERKAKGIKPNSIEKINYLNNLIVTKQKMQEQAMIVYFMRMKELVEK